MNTNSNNTNAADAQGNGKNTSPECKANPKDINAIRKEICAYENQLADREKGRQYSTPDGIVATLAQFTGTEHYYRFWYGIRYLTDGVKYLADAAACYWLLDAIGSYQPQLAKHEDSRLHDVQSWTLKVNADHSAVLTCVADGNEPPAITQAIEYTDFPLPEIDIWVQRSGEDMVALLPSEY